MGHARGSTRWFTAGLVIRLALVLFGLAPLWAPVASGVAPLRWLAVVPELWFGVQCHRDAARGLFVLGVESAVCSRCLGIYLGLAAGALLGRPCPAQPWLTIWIGAAALVLGLDVLTEWLRMRPPSAPLRLLTGALLAYPVATALVKGSGDLRSRKRGRATAAS
ncbi:MAG TPA: DUF2085 domain-containing protein [Polyangiaceae bacterium]|nr:DUF2085 domain-containing protein [Polyangiaceae bacterium]